LQTNSPPVVKIPQRNRSRLVISPMDSAFIISARLARALCASFCRIRDVLLDKYIFTSVRHEVNRAHRRCTRCVRWRVIVASRIQLEGTHTISFETEETETRTCGSLSTIIERTDFRSVAF